MYYVQRGPTLWQIIYCPFTITLRKSKNVWDSLKAHQWLYCPKGVLVYPIKLVPINLDSASLRARAKLQLEISGGPKFPLFYAELECHASTAVDRQANTNEYKEGFFGPHLIAHWNCTVVSSCQTDWYDTYYNGPYERSRAFNICDLLSSENFLKSQLAF